MNARRYMPPQIAAAQRRVDRLLLVLVSIVLAVLLARCSSAEAAPKCYPMVPFTELKLANLQPRTPEGALTRNLFWWCVAKDGKPLMAYTMCAKGHDCDEDAITGIVAKLGSIAADKRLAAADSAWATSTKYDCWAADIVADTTWRGLACKETRDLYAANKSTWEAGYVNEAASPASAVVNATQVFLYFGTDYSGVTGFATEEACFRYAAQQNITRDYTCVTRTNLSVTSDANPGAQP